MPRYFFVIRHGDMTSDHSDGLEFPDIGAVQLEHVSAEQNRKVPGRIKGFPRGCLWVILLALILVWRPSDAKLLYCRDA